MDPKQLLEQYQPKEFKVLKADRQLCAARFSPCGKFLLAGGYDGLVRRWDLSTDEIQELPALTGHSGWVQALGFHPLKPHLFTVDSWGQLCCWPYAEPTPQPLWKVEAAHDGWIRSLAVSPDGECLATGGRDTLVRLWSAADGKKLRELPGHSEEVYSVQFHPGGQALVSGDLKGIVRHWNLADGTCVRSLEARMLFAYLQIQEVGGVRCLAFDAEGKKLACGGMQPAMGANVQGVPTVVLFDWESGRQEQVLSLGEIRDGYVFDVRFHPQGFLMAVTSGGPGSGKLLYRRPEDEAPFFTTSAMANCHALSLHPSGTRLAVTATNRDSAGNGRTLKDGKYPGNWSPIHIFDMPPAGA